VPVPGSFALGDSVVEDILYEIGCCVPVIDHCWPRLSTFRTIEDSYYYLSSSTSDVGKVINRVFYWGVF